jgi:hypothetical protein
MTNYRSYLALVLLAVPGALPGEAGPGSARLGGPQLSPFTCRFEAYDGGARPKEWAPVDRFEVRGTPRRPEFLVRFGGWSAKATIERHEALWPETIELHLAVAMDSITFIELTSDDGRRFLPLFPYHGKSVDYFDDRGNHCNGPEGSAFRFEGEIVGHEVHMRITAPPTARANRTWGILWYTTSW